MTKDDIAAMVEAEAEADWNIVRMGLGGDLAWKDVPQSQREPWLSEAKKRLLAALRAAQERGLNLVPEYPSNKMADAFFGARPKADWEELPVWSGDFGNFAYSWSEAIKAARGVDDA